ncbi:MAG TPA: hypothetical protein VMD30_06040 [Tepidisphaeraceae bacterium]|nr:hypothetical protein [Tepidisphaeraceae bacterium]
MQWVLLGEMTTAVRDALLRHGHKIHAADELELAADAGAGDWLAAAGKRQWDIFTTDAAISVAAVEGGTGFGRSVVYLHLDGGDVEQDDGVDRLFARYKRLTPGRIYTITANRVKVRQLPRK